MEAKLYSPVFCELWEYENDSLSNEPTEMSQWEATHYKDKIHDALIKEREPEETERGLMEYYGGPDGVDKKVQSLFIDLEIHDHMLWAVATLDITESLTREELDTLKDYLEGQYSDGWGENFEQRDIRIDDGNLNVHLWKLGDEFFIDTQKQFSQRTGIPLPADALSQLAVPEAKTDPPLTFSNINDELRPQGESNVELAALAVTGLIRYAAETGAYHGNEDDWTDLVDKARIIASDINRYASLDKRMPVVDFLYEFDKQLETATQYPNEAIEISPELKESCLRGLAWYASEMLITAGLDCEDKIADVQFIMSKYAERSESLQPLFTRLNGAINAELSDLKAEARDGELKPSLPDPTGKGYIYAVTDDTDSYLPNVLHIERDDSMAAFKSDMEAADAAKRDGVPLISGIDGIPDDVYIDTPENRERIENHLFTEGRQRLNERAEQNWDDYRNAPHVSTPDNLFNNAVKVVGYRDAYQFIKDYDGFTAEQLNCLLQFADPVDLISDYLDPNSDISDMPGILANILEEQENFKKHYTLIGKTIMPSVEELEQQLRSRLTDNFNVYKQDMLNCGKNEIFNSAFIIASVNESYEYFTQEHRFTESEVKYLLNFQDPLELISDIWSNRMDIDATVKAVFADQERTLQGGNYMLALDEPGAAPVAPEPPKIITAVEGEKTSVLGFIRRYKAEQRERGAASNGAHERNAGKNHQEERS